MRIAPSRKHRLVSVALVFAALLCLLVGCGDKNEPAAENSTVPKIGYATEGVTAVGDQKSLQDAVDEMLKKAEEGTMALEFQNTATSNDGTNFSLYLANSEKNSYDMFIGIYADDEFTDQLFLSGLLRPGTAFSTITLDRALEPGTHTVYVVHTQVEEDLATIHAQVIITMDFVVSE